MNWILLPDIRTSVEVIDQMPSIVLQAEGLEELLLAVLDDVVVDERGPHPQQFVDQDPAHPGRYPRRVLLDEGAVVVPQPLP